MGSCRSNGRFWPTTQWNVSFWGGTCNGLECPYALLAAAGAAVGYGIALPGIESPRYLGALAAVVAVRLLAKGKAENKIVLCRE